MIKVIPFIYNDIDDLYANTYVIIDDDNNALVIDPSNDNDRLSSYLIRNDLNVKGVLLTHGHFDHIRGVDTLIETFKCPLFIFFLDEEMLTDSYLNGSDMMSENSFIVKSKAETLKEGDKIELLNEDIDIIWTPFHTLGSTCYYLKESKIIFTGDTLFRNGFGRFDLPHSDRSKVQSSLNRLFKLDDDIKVYPGHGESTYIGKEKERY